VSATAIIGDGDNALAREDRELARKFYSYFDLSNEQVFLRMNGRVSRRTWPSWREGIEANARRFDKAWAILSLRAPDYFKELRLLLDLKDPRDIAKDPRTWRRLSHRLLRRDTDVLNLQGNSSLRDV